MGCLLICSIVLSQRFVVFDSVHREGEHPDGRIGRKGVCTKSERGEIADNCGLVGFFRVPALAVKEIFESLDEFKTLAVLEELHGLGFGQTGLVSVDFRIFDARGTDLVNLREAFRYLSLSV